MSVCTLNESQLVLLHTCGGYAHFRTASIAAGISALSNELRGGGMVVMVGMLLTRCLLANNKGLLY